MKTPTAARAVVCLWLWLSACQVSGFHIPAEMNRTIQNLLQHYKVSRAERFDGKPVFAANQFDDKEEFQAKRVFIGGVLETYEKLFNRMLVQLPLSAQTTEDVAHPVSDVSAAQGADASDTSGDLRKKLGYLLEMIQNLRKHSYQHQEKLLKSLHSLRHIQLENTVVQSKALWELPALYEQASSLSEAQEQRRRRRRQARKSKSHQRG